MNESINSINNSDGIDREVISAENQAFESRKRFELAADHLSGKFKDSAQTLHTARDIMMAPQTLVAKAQHDITVAYDRFMESETAQRIKADPVPYIASVVVSLGLLTGTYFLLKGRKFLK